MDVKQPLENTSWQASVKRNTFYSYLLMFGFLLVSFEIGFVIDVLFNTFWFDLNWWLVCKQLITFQRIAYASYGFLLLGGTNFLLFYLFHKRLMLTGLNAVPILQGVPDQTSHPLNDVLIRMSHKIGLALPPELYVAHTPVLNAFVSGLSEKNTIMVLTQGLLGALEPKETQAVILMLLFQIKRCDQRLTLVLAFVSNVYLIVFDLIYHRHLYGKNRDREPNPLLKLAFNGLKIFRFLMPAMTCLMRFVLKPNRILNAQKMCVKLMSENKPLANAMIKINDIQFDQMEPIGEAYSEMALDEIRREAYVFDPADVNKCKTFASPFTTHPSLEEQLEAMGYEN